jgi:hypothetical protein
MRKRSEIGKQTSLPGTTPAMTAAQAQAMTHTFVVTCAKCGLSQPSGTSDCLGCGALLSEMKLAQSPPSKEMTNQEVEQENIGKLAYDMKHRDIDVTLDNLCKLTKEERVSLRTWMDSNQADVPPRIRFILENIRKMGETRADIAPPEPKSVTNVTNIVHKPSPYPAVDSDVGEEVTYTMGKEMYRVAEFCTFDVGPHVAHTRVRPGETRHNALERLRAEMEAFAHVDRIKRRDEFIANMRGVKKAYGDSKE